ncbi:MAG: DUF937 domain-containing protein [Pseudorhodobacter sp.]|nr:DUF937 domain-containing protein [Rhizobacter sp.]
MGLFDSVMGAVAGGARGSNSSAGGIGGLLGSLFGGAGGAGGKGGSGQSALLNIVLGMVANQAGGNQGAGGGLGDLLSKFQQSGLGDVAASWVGSGQNLPVTADQLNSVLGSDMLAQIANQLGVSHGDAADQLSQILPEVIDHLTPQGEAPAGGLGDIASILAQFGPK